MIIITKKNNILVLGKDFVQAINSTTNYQEKLYKISFTEKNKNFCLSLHLNLHYLFVNGTDIHKFKAKDSEIVANPLCLGNISKDFSVDDMKKKTGLNGYVFDFSVDYDAIAVDDILDHTQKFHGKEWHSVKCLDLFKKCFLQQ